MDPNALTLSSDEEVGGARGRPAPSSRPSSVGSRTAPAPPPRQPPLARTASRDARAPPRSAREQPPPPPPSRPGSRNDGRRDAPPARSSRDAGSRQTGSRDAASARDAAYIADLEARVRSQGDPNAYGSATVGTAGARKAGFDDEVLEWLDADPAKKALLHKTRTQDYSRKWYRRAVSSATFVLFWVHLIYVITQLVVKAHLSYFHVLNWIGVAIFLIGGVAVWTHKTSFQMRPSSNHSAIQLYFALLFLYLCVGVVAWFINLFRVQNLVERYCNESPDRECPTGTTKQGLAAVVVIGLLVWVVFFIYCYATITRFAFLYLCTLERHYFGDRQLRSSLRMWLVVALLGRNLCLLSKTLNFLCCQSCTPAVLGKPGDGDEESSYTDEVRKARKSSTGATSTNDEEQNSLTSTTDADASEQAESDSGDGARASSRDRRSKRSSRRDESDDNVKAAHYSIKAVADVRDHGSPNGYLCATFCCWLCAYVLLIACYTSTRSGMVASLGCILSLGWEAWM